MWSWAIHNVNQDFKEREKLLFSFMESLTWWLQPELKGKIEKDKANQWPDADLGHFADGLREGGANEEYIAAEVAKIQEEHKKKSQVDALLDDEEGDEMQVLRGPDK